MNGKEIIEKMEPLVREAGLSALSLQQNLNGVTYKKTKDIVTEADLLSEKILVQGIQKLFPGHAIRTEEAGCLPAQNGNTDFLWVIDPVDVTFNFSRGLPMWGVSAALFERGKLCVALCFLPGLREMYVAYAGGGAFLNGMQITVSQMKNMEQAVVSNGDFNVGDVEKIHVQNLKNFSSEAKACMRVKCLGSAVAEGCFLASGRLDAFVMTMSYPWDIAGIALLIQEAGGCATTISGKPLSFQDGEEALFSNGILHDSFLKLLS